MRKPDTNIKKLGMGLVELIVSMTVFSFVVVGSIASAILFAKLASSHENQADFRSDLRSGFEQLSFDVRNANSVSARSNTGFTLNYASSSSVTYAFNSSTHEITRSESGTSRTLFNDVTEFDVLVDATDATGNLALDFNKNELSIETITMQKSNGTGPDSKFSLTNFTLKPRNS